MTMLSMHERAYLAQQRGSLPAAHLQWYLMHQKLWAQEPDWVRAMDAALAEGDPGVRR